MDKHSSLTGKELVTTEKKCYSTSLSTKLATVLVALHTGHDEGQREKLNFLQNYENWVFEKEKIVQHRSWYELKNLKLQHTCIRK